MYPSKSVFEPAKSIRRTLCNIARGTDLSWERHRFWYTHSNNILHQLKTSLLKDWINKSSYLSSSTSISRSLSFSRLNSRCSVFLQSGWRYLKFFIFWWVHIAALLQWLSRCGAFDERRDDSKCFLGLRGGLVFAASIARFRAVLLENASRTALGEGTGTL